MMELVSKIGFKVNAHFMGVVVCGSENKLTSTHFGHAQKWLISLVIYMIGTQFSPLNKVPLMGFKGL